MCYLNSMTYKYTINTRYTHNKHTIYTVAYRVYTVYIACISRINNFDFMLKQYVKCRICAAVVRVDAL